jgi:hypothetical protein
VTTFLAFVILVIGAAVIAAVAMNMHNNKQLRQRIKNTFGKPPPTDEDGKAESLENIESIAKYADMIEETEPGLWRLDKTTWNDLDMEKVFGRVNVCQSSVGEEYLYNALHELQRNEPLLAEREQLARFLANQPEDRLAVQFALAKIGKENYNGLVRLIFDADERYIKYQSVYTVLALLPLVAAALLFVHIPTGFFMLFGVFVINIAVHHRVKNQLEGDMPAVDYLHLLLVCAKRLCGMKPLTGLPVIENLRSCFARFKPVMHRLPASQNKGTFLDMDFIIDYIRIIFLLDVRNYNKLVQAINRYHTEFHGLYKAVGEIDLALCIVNFRKTLPVWCEPTFNTEATIDFENLVHPLLSQPVANDGNINGDSLLTGSNASGKSTFIKALALSAVLAQTLHTCAAARCTLRFSWVLTSMVMRDDIYSGDSYFIVEIKSLRRILERVQEHPCTCFIDEILRGTNTVERIAASTAMLTWLHKQNCLTVAATHDIELTYLLAESYENYHFCEQVTPTGIRFDYKLKKGPTTTYNAIKLLETMDFAPQIITQAQELVREYQEKQKYM